MPFKEYRKQLSSDIERHYLQLLLHESEGDIATGLHSFRAEPLPPLRSSQDPRSDQLAAVQSGITGLMIP